MWKDRSLGATNKANVCLFATLPYLSIGGKTRDLKEFNVSGASSLKKIGCYCGKGMKHILAS